MGAGSFFVSARLGGWNFFWGGEGGSCGNYCQICGQELIKISMDYAGE